MCLQQSGVKKEVGMSNMVCLDSRKLKCLVQDQRLKQWWLAEMARIHKSTLRRWLHGRVGRVHTERLRRVSEVLEVPLSTITRLE